MSFLQGPNGENVLPIKINGATEPLDINRLIPVVSAAQGKTVHYAQSATPEQATKAAASAYDAYLKWKQTIHTERRNLLLRVADLLDSRIDKFAEIQIEETSAPESWARFNVKLTSSCFREIAANISQESTGEIPPLETPGALCLVYREAIGPVLAISPWNASMVLSGRALAAPIAVGCSVVLKASELSPRVHHYLVEAFEDAGLPKGVINILQAARQDSPAVTEAIISHKAVRKVEFTGSAAVGRIIGQVASKYLKPVLMELGGKAPSIVLKDADVKLAAAKIIDGALIHHGQICMSTDRIVVVKDVAEPLIEELRAYMTAHYPNGAGYAVSQAHAKRAHDFLQDAHKAGARFVIGDGSYRDHTLASLTPTIITDVKPTDAIFREELFAPAAILTVVEDENEAIKVANDTLYGLNAAVHSRDVLAALRVAKQVEAGQVHIGTITEFDEANTPIGGTKESGWGRNNGKYALREFLIEKTITIHDPSVSGNQFGSH